MKKLMISLEKLIKANVIQNHESTTCTLLDFYRTSGYFLPAIVHYVGMTLRTTS